MIRTVIVDAERQDREKIVSLLSIRNDVEVLAHGKDSYDALKLIGSLKPDIAVMDSRLGFIEGEELPPLLKARSPSTAVVILAKNMSNSQLCRAACNKVSGLVCKETDLDDLPGILKRVSQGGCYISPSLGARILNLLSGPTTREWPGTKKKGKQDLEAKFASIDDPAGYLNKTELRILSCLGEGFASNEIAAALDLAVGTVRNYISALMRKTGFKNRSGMVRYACNYGLVPLDRE